MKAPPAIGAVMSCTAFFSQPPRCVATQASAAMMESRFMVIVIIMAG